MDNTGWKMEVGISASSKNSDVNSKSAAPAENRELRTEN
jgi:hypothetical protein